MEVSVLGVDSVFDEDESSFLAVDSLADESVEVESFDDESDFSAFSAVESPLESDLDSGLRESLMYHPEPLNTIPTGYSNRTTSLWHSGQIFMGSSFMF